MGLKSGLVLLLALIFGETHQFVSCSLLTRRTEATKTYDISQSHTCFVNDSVSRPRDSPGFAARLGRSRGLSSAMGVHSSMKWSESPPKSDPLKSRH